MADPQIKVPANVQCAQSSYPVSPQTEDVCSASLGQLAGLSGGQFTL